MKSLQVAKVGILLLASAVLCYGQHGRPSGAMGGHMGPPSGAGRGMAPTDHGQPAAPSQSQRRSTDQLLNQNTKLSANLQKLLPEGMTTQDACSGFKNLGQCVAAIHVSHNLGIAFTDLKDKMTGSDSESLGKAIHELKPDANTKAETKKAEKQAKSDINNSTD